MTKVTPYQPEPEGLHPPYLYPPYSSTVMRSPRQALIRLPQTVTEVNGPNFGPERLWERGADLTRQHEGGEAAGQRIIVLGRVTDGRGAPLRRTLVEVWQANAAGRYRHPVDTHDAPLDPYFTGRGAVVTDNEGFYRFVTIEPGAYPWRNHYNAWRPRHIHFSLFGPAFVTRLVTQMYFPGDPLMPLDPIFNGVPDERARCRLVARLDMESGTPDIALAYRFDIVLRGRQETPMENR